MKIFTRYFIAFLFFILNSSFSIFCSAQASVFYGMTSRGGSNELGAIIMFNPSTDKDSVMWNLGSGNDGATPGGNLVYDAGNGLFYGMTSAGGNNSSGTIISFQPNNNSENVVWNFGNGMDGQSPNGNLVFDAADGLYYGMTYRGGSVGEGVIFTFNPANDSEKVVWNLGTGTDGQHPTGDLIYDATNELYYATTEDGGTTGYGAIISFNTLTNRDSVVWNFKPSEAWGPGGNLAYNATTGLYYTMTQYGGKNDDGAIISFSTVTNKDSVLWSFGSGKDAKYPDRNLVYDANNELYYGLVNIGGSNNDGAIITFNPADDSEKVVWNFGAGTDGQHPEGDLIYDASDGLFYGMTYNGGSNNSSGAIISFNPTTGRDSVLWSFGNGSDGASPAGDLVIYTPTTGTNTINNTDASINIFPNPANGQFTITSLRKGQVVVVYNYLGQKIISVIAEDTKQQLDVSGLPAGIYLVQVFNNDGSVAMQKN